MDKEQETSIEQPKKRWFVAVDWYQQHNRSLYTLAQSYLCAKCAEKIGEEGKKPTIKKLLSTIKNCCAHAPGFITEQLPILESVFRLFLANGNQPLDLEELGKQLNEWRGGDTYRTSAEVLPRLLSNDNYYGIREAPEQTTKPNTLR